jgi:uroporphyrinogen-III synthase
LKVKSILVSQPKPATPKSPYFDLAEKYKLKIDFRPFIQVEPIDAQEFRQARISLLEHSAVIFTSRNAVDHYFRIAEEMRVNVPESMKYFCVSESTAYYLQKYVVYRKRKIFHGKQRFEDLLDVIKKHKNETFLFPCSDIHNDRVTVKLENLGVKFSKAILYRTVAADLSDLENVYYDMLVFFSPSGIESLFKNFPDFKQNKTLIAAFGPTTKKAVDDNDLNMDVYAPQPKTPSMSMAIEQYILNNK